MSPENNMSLENKFIEHSYTRAGRHQRLWIGGALLAWVVMLVAIANMMMQTDSRVAEDQGGILNEIVPAAGPEKDSP